MTTPSTVSADEFQALEQKVLRTVELIKKEREARAAAEAEVVSLRAQLEKHGAESGAELSALRKEREAVRQRVEKLVKQMDELA